MSQAAAGPRKVRRATGWRVLVPALALVLAACGGGDGEEAAALAARVAELEAALASSDTAADTAADTSMEEDSARDAEEGAAAAAAPAQEAAPEVAAGADQPEPAPEAEPGPEPEPEQEQEPEPEPEPEPEVEAEAEAEAEAEDVPATEPITIEMVSQRRANSGAFVVVVRARSDLGGSDWGIRSVVMERPNEYNALLDADATWLGPQTGERDQWTASLVCDRQSRFKDWLFVTATDDEGRTARVRFDVTAAC